MRNRAFAVPPRLGPNRTANAAELRELADGLEVSGLEATVDALNAACLVVDDPELEALRSAAARALAHDAIDPTPPSLDEIAEDFARRWIAADATGKEFLRDEAGSFAEDTKLAVNEAVRRLREVPA